MRNQRNYKKIFKTEILGFLLVLFCLLFIYREVFTQGKIIFPSNFLAQFYSPWSTQKFKGWEGGIPHKPIGGNDQIRFFYPGRTFTNESLKNNSIPLWNPYIFSGNPHLADFQSGVFYPLNLFYLFLPQIFVWSILTFTQPLLAMLFTYFYLRLFPIQKTAAFLGAFAFGFSGFIVTWSQENAVVGQASLWLPLALFGIEGFIRNKKTWYFLISVLALSFSFLAGFFQTTFYIYILVFLYSIFRIYQISGNKTKTFFLVFSIFVFSLSLSAIQLIPSMEAFFESPRPTSSAAYLFSQYLLPVTHIANLLTPDIFGNPGSYNFFGRTFYNETVLYIGVVPLFFALYSFFKFKKNHLTTFFTGSALISFLLIIDSPLTRWFFNLPIPLVSTFVPSRMILITTFSLAVLSAFGLSIWLRGDLKRKYENIIFGGLATILILEFFYGLLLFLSQDLRLSSINNYIVRPESHLKSQDALVMLRNLVLPFFLLLLSFVLIKFRERRNFIILGFIVLTFFSQFYFLNKYLVLGLPQFLYPNHPVFSFLQKESEFSRFITLGQPILSNIPMEKNIYSPEGLDPIYINRYGQLSYATRNEGLLTNNIPRIEVNISDLSDSESIISNKERLRLLSLLGVKYIAYYENPSSKISLNERFPKSQFLPVLQNENWHIFEYIDSLPRTFTVENIKVEKNPQKIVDLIFNSDFDLSKNIVLEETPPSFNSLNENNDKDMLSINLYEPKKVEIETKTENTKILFLSDNYYPGWEAFVDGNPTKIYRANFTFRATVLPKGNHRVTFIYNPKSFKTGLYISSLSGFIFILLAALLPRRRKFFLVILFWGRPKISCYKN